MFQFTSDPILQKVWKEINEDNSNFISPSEGLQRVKDSGSFAYIMINDYYEANFKVKLNILKCYLQEKPHYYT